MKILKYTKTYEECPKGCRGKLSYLHDDQEHKTCSCGTKWNRIDNKIVYENPKSQPLTITFEGFASVVPDRKLLSAQLSKTKSSVTLIKQKNDIQTLSTPRTLWNYRSSKH